MIRNELRVTIRSGELIVGLLSRSTTERSVDWTLTAWGGPTTKNSWHGDAETDDDAFDQIAWAWARWTWWAGLETIAPLQRGARRASS